MKGEESMNKFYKLPYIPNKKMFAAVAGACSYVRATGWFNKATQYYADKYNVNVEEVRRYVRIAQGNGQKKKNHAKPKRKFKWFAVEYSVGTGYENYFEESKALYTVRKGLTEETVIRTMCKDENYDSELNPFLWFGRIEAYDTKKETENCIAKWETEQERKRARGESEYDGR